MFYPWRKVYNMLGFLFFNQFFDEKWLRISVIDFFKLSTR